MPNRVSRMRVGAVGWNEPDVVVGPPALYWQTSKPKQIASRSIVGVAANPRSWNTWMARPVVLSVTKRM